ncbi:unnamed protein product [Rhizoctonia solani]|uniref:F-box domain-containing protein n=1 Tax=Rhizoctonia solani TaxID=456999 RepID=A0A8H3HZP9_9AGAM|nr:unnamed protein product [Rhizoctonia solani]
MAPRSVIDIPSKAQVSEARLTIAHCEQELNTLSCQIAAEESRVVQLIKEAHEQLAALQTKRGAQQKKIENARALLSPIRSMPPELLGNVFIYAFEADPLVAWRLAAVCSAWRRQALSTCFIWTRLHVKTNARADPEFFRLWLERSGNTLPLDIDIVLYDPTPRTRTPGKRRASEGISFAPPSPGLADFNSPPPFNGMIPPFPIGNPNLAPMSPLMPGTPTNPNEAAIAPPPLPQFNPPTLPPLPGLGSTPPIGFATTFSVNAPGLGSLLASLASLNPGGAVANMMANWASNGDGIPGIGLPPPPPPPPFPSMFDGPPSPITELPIDSGNDSDEDGAESHLPMPMPMPIPIRPPSILTRPAHLRAAQSWGHIVLHYLHGVMPRWKRFVLQFENVTCALPGWTALEGLNSKAPLLEEFTVVCSDARGAVTPWITDWSWLPTNLKPNMAPKLRSLELRNMPFAWNAPMLTNLTTLRLGQPMPLSSNSGIRRQQMTIITLGLDRLLNLLQRNPKLEHLELHVTLSDPLLPLEPTELPYLTSLAISGGRNALKLLEHVKLPALQILDVHITARGDMDDVLTRLYVRSANPPVREFRYVAGQRTGWGSSFAGSGPFPVTFLDNISDTIRRLVAVKCTLQTLLSELADAREGAVLCPVLKQLCLFDCHSQHNFVQQLIRLVEARNPAGSANSGVPARLNTLNLRGGPDLDSDVVDWLKTRVADTLLLQGQTALVSNGREVTTQSGRKALGRLILKPLHRFSKDGMIRYILSIPLNFIPVVGTVFFLGYNGAKSGPGYHARYFQLKKFTDDERKHWVSARRGAYTSFGFAALALNLVPFATLVFSCTSAVGAALWAADEEKNQGSRPDMSAVPEQDRTNETMVVLKD